MNSYAWIGVGASILGLTIIVWIFSNPKELGVKETRSLAAKHVARQIFWWVFLWSMSEIALYYLGLRSIFYSEQIPGGIVWLLPFWFLVAFLSYWIKLFSTHPAIAETASDETVRNWQRQLPNRNEWVVLLTMLVVINVTRLFIH